jgi:hypothetical protein
MQLQEDTDSCMSAMQTGHKCKWPPAVIEVLRGVLGLVGLVCLVQLYTYFRLHESLEEQGLRDPLHARSDADKV